MSEDFFLSHPEMDKNDAFFVQLLSEKIEKNGGCLKFQNISGYLSQLNSEIREQIGCKRADLVKFLRKYDDLFAIEKDGTVRLRNNALKSNNNDIPCNGLFPTNVSNVEGVVIKVLPAFGFISATKISKLPVYFTATCFDKKEKSLLTDFIQPGQKVCFNAKIGTGDHQSKYQAIKVWLPEIVENEVLHPEGFKKSRKTRDTGLYDPPSSEGKGKVQKVFDTHGFLIIDNDPQNTVFFHKKVLCNVENITDLTKVLKPGDLLSYNAMRSSKKDAKARWQATKVWLTKQIDSKMRTDSPETTHGNNKSDKSLTREVVKNEKGIVSPHSSGTVIKFGKELEKVADADSCSFYIEGEKVVDLCWEFAEGDHVLFDGIKIKSAPGWKALLAWVGKRPNIVLSMDLGNFDPISDEEVDDIPESSSATSISVSSEISRSSYEKSENGKFHRAQYQNSIYNKSHRSLKSRPYKSDKNFKIHDSSSRFHDNSIKKKFQKSKKSCKQEVERNWGNSENRDTRFEDDSGFGSEDHFVTSKKESPLRFHSETNIVRDKLLECNSEHSDSCEDIKVLSYKSEVYKNWGDSPYPDEENNVVLNEIYETASDTNKSIYSNKSDISSEPKFSHLEEDDDERKVNSDEDFSDDNVEEIKTYNKSDYEKKHPKSIKKGGSLLEESTTQSNSSMNDVPEFEFGKESYLNDEGELQNSSSGENDMESVFEAASEETLTIKETKSLPYIKKFCGIEGQITKVYCRYALVENSNLKKPVSFFWTDLYCNKLLFSENHDSLKVALKEGDIIKFNCIEVMDDSESIWQKVTMAWKGEKPMHEDMTPMEYISENKLVVSVGEDQIEIHGDDSCKRLLNSENQEPVLPRKKFLIPIDDEPSEDLLEPPCNFQTCAGTEKQPTTDHHQCTEEEVSDASRTQILPTPVFHSDLKLLEEAIKRKLVTYKRSELDVDVISSDIVNLLFSKAKSTNAPVSKLSDKHYQEKGSQTQNITLVEGNCVGQKYVMDTPSQTIITGDVIAQSIFTQ